MTKYIYQSVISGKLFQFTSSKISENKELKPLAKATIKKLPDGLPQVTVINNSAIQC